MTDTVCTTFEQTPHGLQLCHSDYCIHSRNPGITCPIKDQLKKKRYP